MVKRLLLTRPAGRGEALADALHRRGWQTDSMPLLRIVPLPCTPPSAKPDRIIVISANAARLGLPLLPTAWQSCPLFAVGQASAAACREQGWAVVAVPSSENSEGLLAMTELQQVDGKNVLLIAGEGGRELLADSLQKAGAAVHKMAVYRREPLDQVAATALRQWCEKPGWVLISSGEALQTLLQVLPEAARVHLHIAALGERITAMAQAHFEQVQCLPEISVDAIELLEWKTHH